MKTAKGNSRPSRRNVNVPLHNITLPPALCPPLQVAIRAMLARYERNKIIAAIFGAGDTLTARH